MEQTQELGLLFINYTKSAAPVADHLIEESIEKAWRLVKNGTQNKQLNTSNYMTLRALDVMCKHKDIDGSRVRFMYENTEVETMFTKYMYTNKVRPYPNYPLLKNEPYQL